MWYIVLGSFSFTQHVSEIVMRLYVFDEIQSSIYLEGWDVGWSEGGSKGGGYMHWYCSVAKSCPTLCDPMNCSTPGFPVLHYVLEFTQTHVH